MILESLRERALREGLVDDPAFESKPVRWVIELLPDGHFLQLYDTNSPEVLPEGSKKKPRMEAKLMVIPRRQVRSSGIKADFLVDNAKYVLGLSADPADADPKNAARHAAYVALLRAAPQTSPELQAVLAFLSSDAERTACAAALASEGGFASNDLFTFEIDEISLNAAEDLCAHWAALNAGPADDRTQVQCLVCGQQRPCARLHNSIQIRGASTSGVPLVSFNADAFEKYGWSGNANAPVCTACMTAYVEALRRLTRARYDNPRDGKRMQPLSTVLTGNTTAIYWSDSDDELVAGLPTLRDNPKSVQGLLDSPRKGTEYRLRNAAHFFCFILTGAQGRAIVRRLHTGTVAEVESNLRLYFAAIDVERFDREAPLPQFRLLKSLVLNGELDRLPADLGTELWLHALFGDPLSRSFLATVVTRNRAERKVTAERAALLHLFFQSHSLDGSTASNTVHAETSPETASPMSLNRDTKDPPYLLGRLLAALENLQIAAQGQNLNRTLVDRTFGAASTRPGVVFPQLINTAQHHLSKAGKKAAGRAVSLNRLLGEIMDGLDIDGFSPTLNLEQQGRFALGYYHQRQSFYRKADHPADASPETSFVIAEETIA